LSGARSGNVTVVTSVLQNDVNVNYQGHFGYTALHFAAYLGHVEIAKLLLEAGAAVDMPNDQGGTPLMVAALNGRLPMVQLLIASGADVNLEDQERRTALDCAMGGGVTFLMFGEKQPAVVQYLKSLATATIEVSATSGL
jgi:uncharacterized protein